MKLPVNYDELSITDRRLVREEYIKMQDGRCQYCQQPLKFPIPEKAKRNRPINKNLFPKGFFKWPIHLHHDHNTGMTIGAVHNYCNAVLWEYHNQ